MEIDQILNLQTYPLDDLDCSRGQELVQHIRHELEQDGSCVLVDFALPAALTEMARQALSLEHVAFRGPTSVSPYYFNYRLGEGLGVSPEHPLKRRGRRILKQVAGDLIPEDHLLSVLYFSPLMTGFLSRVLDRPVYRNKDRYQSLNINLQDEGGCQQWHFDTAHMVTTLLLQAPESGGIFEYCPRVRSDSDENFDEVRKVLDETSENTRKLHLEAGMLSLFEGHYSMHRVTVVRGARKRVQAILGYTPIPGLTGSLDSSILHYGPRVADLEALNSQQ